MAYPFSSEHNLIRETARGFLQEWFDDGKGPEKVFKSGQAFDAAAWTKFTQELGMSAIAIDESYGGAGMGELGLIVVMEELGASLCSIPFLSGCAVVAGLLEKMGEDQPKSKILPKIATGELIAVYCEGDGNKANYVANGSLADLIVFPYFVADGIDYIGISAQAKGLSITPHKTMDPSRNFASVDWSGVADSERQIIGYGSKEAHRKMIAQSHLALAAESIGGAQKCLDMTLEYTAQRIQFDRPIASFQAIKHRCADMFILLEAARSAVYGAAVATDIEKTQACLVAKAYATDAFYKIAGDAIQLHGGIGFTWEYPLHFFFKRARANRTMFGTPQEAYADLADDVLGEAE